MKISNFFTDEYVNYASYDNVRKIASVIDGQKLSARKIIHTIQQKNITKPEKVSRLGSKVSEFTEFLHGDVSLCGVIANMAQNHTGTNNIPLLQREGNFGNRLIPVPSASRYIFTCQEDYFKYIFNSQDNDLLEYQEFEGTSIEPKYFMPTMPMLLINGANGISSGYRQIILPRDPAKIEKIIINYIEKNKPIPTDIKPSFTGFTGKVQQNETPGSYTIYGNIEVSEKPNEFIINELPVGYTIESYTNILDRIVDENDAIKSYDDMSQDNQFLFKVQTKKDFYNKHRFVVDWLFNFFKLKKTLTESYYCIDEQNKVAEFDNIGQILKKYVDIRLDYYSRRKQLLIDKYSFRLQRQYSIITFLKMVIDGKIDFKKISTKDLESIFNKTDNIIKIENSYDYLLNINIRKLTRDELKKVAELYKKTKDDLEQIKSTAINTLWKQDMNKLEKSNE